MDHTFGNESASRMIEYITWVRVYKQKRIFIMRTITTSQEERTEVDTLNLFSLHYGIGSDPVIHGTSKFRPTVITCHRV